MATERERDFFVRFQDFKPQQSASTLENFRALAFKRKWGVGTKVWLSNWLDCFGSPYNPDPLRNKFFDNFVDFNPDESASDLFNFHALAGKRGWAVNAKRWRRNWKACFGSSYTPTQNASTLYTPVPEITDTQSLDSHDEVLDFKPDPLAALVDGLSRLTTQPTPAQSTPTVQSYNNYYSRFPGFQPDPHASLADEFARLAKFNGWKKSSDEWRQHRAKFYDEEFAFHFGASATKLENWQRFCKTLDMPVGNSITQCKKILKTSGVYFNIVNVVNFMRNPEVKLLRFTDWKEFVKYTKNGRIFPLHAAKADKLLRQLLQHIRWSNFGRE